MKHTLKRTLAVFLAVIMMSGGAPVGALAGLTDRLGGLNIAASAAHTWAVGDIGTFGSYPQTIVTDVVLLTTLSSKFQMWHSYGYYSGTGSVGSMTQDNYMIYSDATHNGSKYRAVFFTSYRPQVTIIPSSASNSYQDDNGYYTDTFYVFKYEPLRWRVLDPSSGLVMCEDIIDSQAYSNTIYGPPYYNSSACTAYANDYATSSMRTWLNDDFYNTAFTSTEQSDVKTTALDNSAWPGYSPYNSASTNDKLFLLSYSESTNTAYGFSSSTASSATRYAQGSDYAKCQGLHVYSSPGSGYDKNSDWFLRSPGGYSNRVSNVGSSGLVSSRDIVDNTSIGVRPAFKFSSLSSLSTIPVTGVLLGAKSLSLTVSETSQLTAEVQPSDAADKSLTWTSSDTAVAAVDENGIVTAVAPGTATITVRTADGGFTDTCEVTVTAPSLTKIEIKTLPIKTSYFIGDTLDMTGLTLSATYSNNTTQTISSGFVCSPTTLNTVGTQILTVTYEGKSCTFYVDVNKIDASGFTVTAIPNQTYTGSAITPTFEVKFNGETLVLNTDYTVSYSSNINAGTATVTITGKGNFEGTTTEPFNIIPANASDFTVMAIPDQTYTGSAITPTVVVNFNGTTLVLDTDYTVSYTSNINAGTATVTITGKGNFEGMTTEPFNIIPANASDFTVMAIPDRTYTGSAITPTVEVKFNGKTLVLDTDYILSYTNNINVGMATVTITGIGNFTGTKPATFNINAANASGFTVTAIPDQTYTGSAITPTVVVKFNGETLTLDTDYTVVYTKNINVGTATVTITGIGNFTGTKTANFEITAASARDFTLTIIPAELTYTGKALTPTVDVVFNGKKLNLGSDYTLAFTDNINVGTAAVTVKGVGNFEGEKIKTFTINAANASGFAVTAIPDQTYTGSALTPAVEVKFNGTTLELGKDYTVAYADNIKVGEATVTITGIGNFTGTKTANFDITAASARDFTLTIMPAELTYTGKALTPTVEVVFNGKKLELGSDYTLAFTDNINVGTAAVTVKGVGNFEGEKIKTFTINAANASGFAVTAIPDQTYTGSAFTPAVEVKFNGTTLELGKDYTVAFADNIKVGTATVTIMGIGNFEGEKTVSFEIIAVLPEKISLSEKALTLYFRDLVTLTAEIEPADTTNKNIIWTSSDEKVVTVDQRGNLTVVGRGTAIITATVEGSDISDTCTVTVKFTYWQWILKVLMTLFDLVRSLAKIF